MAQRYRDQVHAQEMLEKVKRSLASTLSQIESCRAEGLVYDAFRYWLKKYQLKEPLSSPSIETPTDSIPLRARRTYSTITDLYDRVSVRHCRAPSWSGGCHSGHPTHSRHG